MVSGDGPIKLVRAWPCPAQAALEEQNLVKLAQGSGEREIESNANPLLCLAFWVQPPVGQVRSGYSFALDYAPDLVSLIALHHGVHLFAKFWCAKDEGREVVIEQNSRQRRVHTNSGLRSEDVPRTPYQTYHVLRTYLKYGVPRGTHYGSHAVVTCVSALDQPANSTI